jgi:hypothetical protein
MGIEQGIARIDLKKYDFRRQISLSVMLGELQDYCSDSTENLNDFKKFKMILNQLNIIKELQASNDVSSSIPKLVKELKVLGIDEGGSLWALEIVVKKLNLKYNFKKNSVTNNQSLNATNPTGASINSKRQVKKSNGVKQPQVSSGGANINANLKRKKYFKPRGNSWLLSAIFLTVVSSIFFLVRGLNYISGPIPIYSSFALMGISFFYLIKALDFNNRSLIILSIVSFSLSFYSMLLAFGFGFIYGAIFILGLLIAAVASIVAIDDDDFEIGNFVGISIGLSTLNFALIQASIYSGGWVIGLTSVLISIEIFAALKAFSDYEEGFGVILFASAIAKIIHMLFVFNVF